MYQRQNAVFVLWAVSVVVIAFFFNTGKTPGRCYFMPQKYGKYFNYQNFYFSFCICGKKNIPDTA